MRAEIRKEPKPPEATERRVEAYRVEDRCVGSTRFAILGVAAHGAPPGRLVGYTA